MYWNYEKAWQTIVEPLNRKSSEWISTTCKVSDKILFTCNTLHEVFWQFCGQCNIFPCSRCNSQQSRSLWKWAKVAFLSFPWMCWFSCQYSNFQLLLLIPTFLRSFLPLEKFVYCVKNTLFNEIYRLRWRMCFHVKPAAASLILCPNTKDRVMKLHCWLNVHFGLRCRSGLKCWAQSSCLFSMESNWFWSYLQRLNNCWVRLGSSTRNVLWLWNNNERRLRLLEKKKKFRSKRIKSIFTEA